VRAARISRFGEQVDEFVIAERPQRDLTTVVAATDPLGALLAWQTNDRTYGAFFSAAAAFDARTINEIGSDEAILDRIAGSTTADGSRAIAWSHVDENHEATLRFETLGHDLVPSGTVVPLTFETAAVPPQYDIDFAGDQPVIAYARREHEHGGGSRVFFREGGPARRRSVR
jgi:hypothetical protein